MRAARRLSVPLICLALSLALVGPTAAEKPEAGGWRQLFNGKDLSGWDTWLAKPQGSKEPIGLNKDPKKVFTVAQVDGKPAIRISGEVFGALTSKDTFSNYHVKLEIKWGQKKWPPREKAVRDSGLLYHCVGPHGAGGGSWMQSLECQIQEKDCGDFWSVAQAIVDVKARLVFRNPGSPIRYNPEGMKFTVPRKLNLPGGKTRTDPRVVKSEDFEKPGEWNTIEVLTVGGTSVHLVNGKPNMVLTNARRMVAGKEVPLTGGKIQIQSEGAEVFYRNIAVRPLKEIPPGYLK
jgi:3-keto-disaccharide hydrolase